MNEEDGTGMDRHPEDINAAEVAAGLAATPGYRYADRVGDRLSVAGQVPLDGTGELIGRDDAAAQSNACLDNLQTLLGVHAFAVDDIRHLTVYVVGEHQHLLHAWAAVIEWFDGSVPPATLLGVNLLGHTDQIVEIDAIIERNSSVAPPATRPGEDGSHAG